MIETVSEQRLRELFVTMLEKYPSLVFDVLEPAPDRPDHGHPPPAGEGVPDWCICGKCRIMRKTIEEVCCRKATCLTLLADFEVLILDEAVLSLARKYRQDMIRADDEADDNNRANRHAAYHQFILWVHGRLGAGQRRVIPSCCVWKIRDKFPDAWGQYTGFKPDRFGD
ncbi:hypothetical protein V1264_016968 [Littorina saxatilis]|uniref:P2X purinoreceptor 7 intracellular domain-containing protein n=1 Tax=Littorina saxatilis TaxID=31220 RepID=A0AAN9BIJ5_9CAEN